MTATLLGLSPLGLVCVLALVLVACTPGGGR